MYRRFFAIQSFFSVTVGTCKKLWCLTHFLTFSLQASFLQQLAPFEIVVTTNHIIVIPELTTKINAVLGPQPSIARFLSDKKGVWWSTHCCGNRNLVRPSPCFLNEYELFNDFNNKMKFSTLCALAVYFIIVFDDNCPPKMGLIYEEGHQFG